MRKMGVPYPSGYESLANTDLETQAKGISDKLQKDNKIQIGSDKEIIAMIAYLQRVGKDIKLEKTK